MTSGQTYTSTLDELLAQFNELRQSGDQEEAMAFLDRVAHQVNERPQSLQLAVHAALMLARYCLEIGRHEAGFAAADRAAELSQGTLPATAQAALLQELLRAALGQELRPELVAALAEQLVAAGCWEDAYLAHDTLARGSGDDIARCRRHTANAIGCAESSGNFVLTTAALQHLAEQEVLHGSPRLALRNIEQALYRAQAVLLNGARLWEARCLETAGDAHRALQDWEQAAAQYSDAIRRFTKLNQHSSASQAQQKLDTLNGEPA